MCAAFFLTGLVDAVCGGGGLISIPVLMMTGIPPHTVIGTNQSVAGTGLLASFLKYRKTGYIYWPVALSAAPTVLLGAVLGAQMNLMVPERLLQILLIILVPVVAIVVLTNRDFGTENRIETLANRQMILRAMIIGLIVGIYQGFYGAGSGTFMILALTMFLRQDLVQASGTAKFMLLIALIAGAVTYIASGNVIWKIAIPGMIFNAAGGYCGAMMAVRKGETIIRPMFIGILILLVIKTIADLLP